MECLFFLDSPGRKYLLSLVVSRLKNNLHLHVLIESCSNVNFSPYWLVSWEYTFSPFKSMGLWEFCFKDYRHPHFQFDKLFTGCHYVFSEEYRIIREWLLPGKIILTSIMNCSEIIYLDNIYGILNIVFTFQAGLMTVQAFYTLGFMGSFGTQIILAFLVTRWPLSIVLSSEWILVLICCIGNGVTCNDTKY